MPYCAVRTAAWERRAGASGIHLVLGSAACLVLAPPPPGFHCHPHVAEELYREGMATTSVLGFLKVRCL